MSNISLRDYQVKGIRMLNESIKAGHRRICWVFPTGAGKSTLTSAYVLKCVQAEKRVLFFVHSKELVQQFAERLYKQFGILSGVIMAGVPPKRHLPVQVASVQTLVRRDMPKADIIFIDETHRAKANSYQKILSQYPNAIVVGLTATPFRGDGKGLSDIFETIVHPIRIRELISRKYLVATEVYVSKDAPDLTGVKTVRGEFDQAQLLERFNDSSVATGVVDNYLKHAKGKKAIVFNVNIEHSKDMNRRFNEAGIPSAHIDGTTPKAERERIVSDFAKGKYTVLHNIAVFTEGFDIPDTEVVILNRATQSKGLYVQMVGRGLRPVWESDYSDHKKAEDGTYLKPHCIVLDHGGNTIRHGFVEDYDGVPFTLEGIKKKKKQEGEEEEDKVKICPSCMAANAYTVSECRNCGSVFPKKVRETKFSESEEFVRLERSEMIVQRLMAIPYRDLRYKVPASQLRLYARIKGYKPYWYALKAVQLGYVKGITQDNPALMQVVNTVLEGEEIAAGTHELYLQMRSASHSYEKAKANQELMTKIQKASKQTA